MTSGRSGLKLLRPDDGRFASWCVSCVHGAYRASRQGDRSVLGTSGRNSNAQDQFGRRNCVNARWCRSLGHLDHSLRHETDMTIHFSKQPIAVLSDGLPKMGTGLVRRLVCARDDPGKARIRMWLIDLDDAQLQSGLGLMVADIAVLRTGTRTASPLR